MTLFTLLDATIKGSLLLVAALLLVWAMKRWSAAARHLVLFGALLGYALMPILCATLPTWRILPSFAQAATSNETSPARPTASQAEVALVAQPGANHVVETDRVPGSVAPATPTSAAVSAAVAETAAPAPPKKPVAERFTFNVSWPLVLAAIWLVGALYGVTRIIGACFSLASLTRQSPQQTAGPLVDALSAACARLGLRPRVILYEGDAATMPMTWGILRPRLIVPTAAQQWSPELRDLVLEHELAHIARHDHLTQLIAQVVRAIAWFNPLVWGTVSCLQLEREIACDDRALNHMPIKASNYAEQLVALSVGLYGKRTRPIGIAMACPSGLERRVIAILDSTRNRRIMSQRSILGSVIGMLVISSVVAAAGRMAQAKPPAKGTGTTSSKSDAGVPFFGLVLREDGQPAVGAKVTAAALFYEPALRYTTTTDQQGRFEFSLQPLYGEAEHYNFAVRWQNQGTEVGKSTGTKAAPQVIHLRKHGKLRGKLLAAEDGKPIANGKVFLDSGDVLVADANGAFEVDGLPMKDHSLIPVAPGRVMQYVLFDTTLRPVTDLTVRLERGATITGRVLDEAGKPIRGAYLTRASSGTALTLNGWDQACKPDGTFVYGGLSTQRLFYNLQVRAPGYEEFQLSSEVTSATDVIEKTIRLVKDRKTRPQKKSSSNERSPTPPSTAVNLPQRTISGTVMDDTGKPIAGASVRWGTYHFSKSKNATTTDTVGKFTLSDLPHGSGAVQVIAAGFAPTFASAKDNEIKVTLSRGKTVRGVVRSASGKPISGVHVIPQTQCPEGGYCNPVWLDDRSARTNANGEFTIAAIPTSDISFDFLKEGFSDQRGVALKADKDNEVKLITGGALRGLVVDSAGRPVRNFNVRVYIPRKWKAPEQVGGYYAGFEWYGITYTNDDGVFVITDVGANTWLRLIVTAPGAGSAVLDRAKTGSLDELPPPEKLTIKLKPFQPLEVHVVDKKRGEPVADALVSLLEDVQVANPSFGWGSQDLWAIRQNTNNRGIATFSEAGSEDGTITVIASKFARQRVAWPDGVKKLEVKLEPEATLSGKALLSGKPLSGGYVRLTSKEHSISVLLDGRRQGEYEFKQLPAGEYDLTLTDADGTALDSRKLKITRGESAEQDFNIEPKGAT